ncbi:MAG: thermonuclease family protein [Hyphomicrobiaceae bacterium]|nr:thermonuclease family protein [Hyphomicrobiaceae bacterium]
MIVWRRKSDGFEWHKHVRTTIRLKRADRRRRIEGARLAAADGLKDAGRVGVAAGRSGLALAGEWAGSAATAARAEVARLARSVPPAWAWFRPKARDALRRVWGLIEGGLARLHSWLRDLPALRSIAGARGARAASTALALLLVASAALGGSWLVWRGAAFLAGATGLSGLFAQTVEGRAVAISGDALRIGEAEIRLAGIEAPDPGQRCSRPGNRRWRCGAAARDALAQRVRGASVSCTLSGSDGTGRALGRCTARDQDIAEGLVREGHVFAEAGLFSKYAGQEEEARAEKAGLWRGEAERPSEARAKASERQAREWEEAARTAPGGCPVKGQVVSGRKYYVPPGSADYARIRVRGRRGERWFCSEEEALAAGWMRSPRS